MVAESIAVQIIPNTPPRLDPTPSPSRAVELPACTPQSRIVAALPLGTPDINPNVPAKTLSLPAVFEAGHAPFASASERLLLLAAGIPRRRVLDVPQQDQF